jgi:hypothetical protein
MTHVATAPYTGLRCRELNCQKPIILVPTPKGRQMPVERDPLTLDDLEPTELPGIFVLVAGTTLGAAGLAYTLVTARREFPGLVGPTTAVYRAHWAACPAARDFRRSRS